MKKGLSGLGGLAHCVPNQSAWRGLSKEDALSQCKRADRKGPGSHLVWTEERWWRFIQSPPNGLILSGSNRASHLIRNVGGQFADIPFECHQYQQVRTSPPLQLSDVQHLLLSLTAHESGIASQVFEEVQAVCIVDASGNTINDVRTRGLLYVDCPVPPYGVSRRGSYVPAELGVEMLGFVSVLASEVVSAASELRNVRIKVPTKIAKFVVLPTAGQLVHEIIGHVLESLDPGHKEPLILPGRRATAALLTVTDDPTIQKGFASRLIDDVGAKAKPVTLIKEGIVVEGFGCGTGNLLRANANAPLRTRMSNIVIQAGQVQRRELLHEISDAILVAHLGAASFDPRKGTFRIQVTEANLVNGGEIGDPIAPFWIEGDALSALARLVAADTSVGDDPSYCLTKWGPAPTMVRQPGLVFDFANSQGSIRWRPC